MSQYVLKLFVAGDTLRTRSAVGNLREICERYLKDRYSIEVIDILQHPDQAEAERIIATPTLLVIEPLPGRRVVGDLSVTDRVLVALGLKPHLWTWSPKSTS